MGWPGGQEASAAPSTKATATSRTSPGQIASALLRRLGGLNVRNVRHVRIRCPVPILQRSRPDIRHPALNARGRSSAIRAGHAPDIGADGSFGGKLPFAPAECPGMSGLVWQNVRPATRRATRTDTDTPLRGVRMSGRRCPIRTIKIFALRGDLRSCGFRGSARAALYHIPDGGPLRIGNDAW